jgi:RNA polymerase sigma-70 factor (ECF subfamily)
MTDASDSELMERYANGDARAFELLFERYEGRAFGFFMRRTGSEDRSRDLYQELFLRLHRFRDRYDPTRPFSPWFFQIARNVLVDEARRALRQREVALDDEVTSSPEPDPESHVDLRRRALQLLSRIPAEQGAIVVAAKVQGLEYGEIARRAGRSVDAVKQSASRALRKLRFAAEHPQAADG